MDDYAVDMAELLLYSYSHSQSKISELTSADSAAEFDRLLCSRGNITGYFRAPPDRSMDIDRMMGKLCSIEFQRAAMEAMEWLQTDREGDSVVVQEKSSLQDAARALKSLSNTVGNLTKSSAFLGSLKFRWLNEEQWKAVVQKYFDHMKSSKRYIQKGPLLHGLNNSGYLLYLACT